MTDTDTPGQSQVYVLDVDRGPARPLTRLTGALGLRRFSPDGGTIAFLFTENARAAAGPVAAKPAETGVIGERMDVQRLAAVEVSSGAMRVVSPPTLYIHEFDWSPDGKRIAATAAPPPGDDGWYVAELYAIDAATGEPSRIFAPSTQIGCPRWSPNGSTIAFIAGLMSDEGVLGGEVYITAAAGGPPRNLTPGLSASASWLAWRPGGREILFAEWMEGGSGIASVEVETGRVSALWTGAERLSAAAEIYGPNVAAASDGRTTAAVRQSFDEPPEVWAGPIEGWTRVSRANADARRLWGDARSLTWRSGDFAVQGWLVAPRELAPGRRYPMVVSVHGGPAAAVVPAWPPSSSALALATDGFFVFMPNPRGSYGKGLRFASANVKDLGGGDLKDIWRGLKAFDVKTELVVYAGEGHWLTKPDNRRDQLRRSWSWFRENLETAAPH